MSTPLFSIIMPVYNRLDLMEAALRSVHAQTDTDFELIVVDDGSEHTAADGLQALSSEFGFTLIHQQNAGPGIARNRGATAALGRYLVFLDSDDTLYPWALAIYRKVIEEHGQPGVVGAKFFPVDYSEPPDLEQSALEIDSFGDFLECSRGESFLGACNQIVRKDVFELAEGFTVQNINCEDHDLMLRLGTVPDFIRIVNPPTVAYRVHDNQLTNLNRKTVEGVLHLLDSERSGKYPGGSERSLDRHRILVKHTAPVSLACLAAGDRATACRIYLQTWSWNCRLIRWKYLLGFPLKWLGSFFKKPPASEQT